MFPPLRRVYYQFYLKVLNSIYHLIHFLIQSILVRLSVDQTIHLLHFVAFFHIASLLSTGVDNEKVGVDNEKALELTNSTVFHRGRQ